MNKRAMLEALVRNRNTALSKKAAVHALIKKAVDMQQLQRQVQQYVKDNDTVKWYNPGTWSRKTQSKWNPFTWGNPSAKDYSAAVKHRQKAIRRQAMLNALQRIKELKQHYPQTYKREVDDLHNYITYRRQEQAQQNDGKLPSQWMK